MFKVIFISFMILFFTGCGVETSSSAWKSVSNGDNNDNNSTTDPNDNNDTVDPGDNGDPGSGGNTDSIFDTVNAIYDANACNPETYRVASDASYGGDNSGENGASPYVIVGQGLEIRSEHLEPDITNNDKTWVMLFYKSFPDPSQFNVQGSTSYKMDGVFFLTYDIAWSDESIPGIDSTVYVQSMQDIKPDCYRLKLNSVSGSQIDVQKVYR